MDIRIKKEKSILEKELPFLSIPQKIQWPFQKHKTFSFGGPSAWNFPKILAHSDDNLGVHNTVQKNWKKLSSQFWKKCQQTSRRSDWRVYLHRTLVLCAHPKRCHFGSFWEIWTDLYLSSLFSSLKEE